MPATGTVAYLRGSGARRIAEDGEVTISTFQRPATFLIPFRFSTSPALRASDRPKKMDSKDIFGRDAV